MGAVTAVNTSLSQCATVLTKTTHLLLRWLPKSSCRANPIRPLSNTLLCLSSHRSSTPDTELSMNRAIVPLRFPILLNSSQEVAFCARNCSSYTEASSNQCKFTRPYFVVQSWLEHDTFQDSFHRRSTTHYTISVEMDVLKCASEANWRRGLQVRAIAY